MLRPAGIDDIAACHSLRPGQFVPGIGPRGNPAPLDASAAAYVGDGGLCATATSLAKWLRVALAPDDAAWRRSTNALADGTQVPYGLGLSTREFLGQPMVWHGGNLDSHTALIAYMPETDLGIVLLTARGFVWLTELLPALTGAKAPTRTAGQDAPLSGDFEDGLFTFAIAPDGEALQVEIDLIGQFRFVPAGPGEYVAEELPATFRLRLPADGSRDRFELDWGAFRSYAKRAKD